MSPLTVNVVPWEIPFCQFRRDTAMHPLPVFFFFKEYCCLQKKFWDCQECIFLISLSNLGIWSISQTFASGLDSHTASWIFDLKFVTVREE